MKKLLLSASAFTLMSGMAQAQCTPVDCSASLPAYGGVCDTLLIDAEVNQPYSDFESFVLTPNCFDAGLIDPGSAGLEIRITNIDGFTYSGFPAGVTGQTNQASYAPSGMNNTLGCLGVSGTPTEIGVFNCTMDFLADVITCGFIQLPQPDNAANYVLWLTVRPNAAFTVPSTDFCVSDAAVNLTVTGTAGGTFSGPGVTGNSFNPATAGVGAHEIMYVISAQQGAAIAPAADTMIMTVNVYSAGTTFYQDADNDGFGDPNASALGCSLPDGYVSNNLDCDDADPNINPNETDIPDNGIDEDCSGADATASLEDIAASLLEMYPNPTNGLLNIDLKTVLINSIEVVDLNGRVVNNTVVNENSYTADLTSLLNGVYLVKINTPSGMIQKRVLVQK
jgi:hypothetical protein